VSTTSKKSKGTVVVDVEVNTSVFLPQFWLFEITFLAKFFISHHSLFSLFQDDEEEEEQKVPL
jgi:hypothetical protein